jgi:thioredoxin-like negative regulator of GroEL
MKNTLFSIVFLLISPIVFAQVYWVKDFEQAKALAEKQNKLILVDFWATWCGPCRKMDQDVWSQSEINELSKKFVMAKVDVDFDKATARKYAANAIPKMLILDPFGEIIDERTGYQALDGVQAFLNGYPAEISQIVSQTKVVSSSDEPTASDYIQLGAAFQYYLR